MNPSLGPGRADINAIRKGVRALGKTDELAAAQEYLGYWLPEARADAAIPAGAWESCAVEAAPEPAPGEVVSYGVKYSPDGRRVAACACRTAPGEPVVSLEKVDYHKESKHNGLSGVSLTVGRGEIVGIAGVDGNGQSQLAQVVTGVLTPDAGHVDLKGSRVAQFTPNGFILESVSHIPEDRNKMGLIGSMSIQENIVLKSTDTPQFSSARGFRLKKRAIREYAEKMREKYDIRCTSVDQETRNLSGGNQQKVILARELEGHPDLLVAVHPTRGLDIGATRFVHDTMIEAREKGCGVLLISADFDEILEVSDRIVVMFEGQVMGVFSGKEPPIQDISLAMAGK